MNTIIWGGGGGVKLDKFFFGGGGACPKSLKTPGLEHCVSSAKVVGSIPREHMYGQKNV